MRVEVQLFAAAREAAGSGRVELELADGSTVSDALRELAEQFPRLGPILPQVRVAVGVEYADGRRLLSPGCQLALIPPVSGG